jgi:mono/diheme cytochrome c family protein
VGTAADDGLGIQLAIEVTGQSILTLPGFVTTMSIPRAVIFLIAFALLGAAPGRVWYLPVQAAPPATPMATATAQQAPSGGGQASVSRALLDKYCVTCHNQKLKTAGLALDGLDILNVGEAAPVWEKVVRKLRSGAMPPAGSPRPDKASYHELTSHLATTLDRAAFSHPNPGRPSIHRLNRVEYANAIRDLLGIDIDVRSMLPADDSGYGFDNIADVLSVSPALMERYMVAAGKIGRLAIGDPTIRPAVSSYRVSPMMLQIDRMSEDLPFGSRGGVAVRHQFPVDGEYVVRIRLQHTTNSPFIRGLTKPHRLEVRLDRERIKDFAIGGGAKTPGTAAQVEYEETLQAGLEVRFATKAGARLIGVAFQRVTTAPEGIFQPRPPVASFEHATQRDADPAVDSVEIVGPYVGAVPRESPARQRIFVCAPTGKAGDEACATKILTALARRAYRRAVTPANVQPLISFYRIGRREHGFDSGIEWALERLLVDPSFLFRIERDPAGAAPGTPYRLSDAELASRLSFFLWSSIPDDQLLELAIRGRLKDPAVLEQQIRRMLADERSSALVTNFASQWLYLRNIRAVLPDPEAFPEFDDNLREAFQQETDLFFNSQVREDHSVVDLLTADYTFVNERLARHYDIPDVYGSHFRRVALPDDRRAGLLGQGSILTVTSYANRTSPVVRGKWLLENLLAAPPPPPPPNVPALKDAGEGGRPASVRERLELHRKNPTCAACHARMDPLGFALENFDAIGRWRTVGEANTPIDASGTLADGTRFNGPAEFRRALLTHREEFVTAVTEKLLTYGLGRGLEYYDAPAVRAILQEATPGDYRWSSIIMAIIKSTPFQMRTALPFHPGDNGPTRAERSHQQ